MWQKRHQVRRRKLLSTYASYSHSYTRSDSDGSRFMFLARGLIGSYTKGRPDYRRPQLKDPSDPANDLYDSCVDNECNPKIFIIFASDQFYPEHIIKYLTLEQIIITANSWGFYTSPNINGTGSNLKKPAAAPRPSENHNTNPWSPRKSLRANRARFYSASNLQQPLVAAPRSAHYHKANPWSPSTSQSPTLAMSYSDLNVQQRSVQNYKANPWSPSTSLSANRTLSYSDLNLQLPATAQNYKANPWSASTSLSAKRAPSYSASNLQQPITTPVRSHGNAEDLRTATTSLRASNRSLFTQSVSNLQQTTKASGSSQGNAANSTRSSDNSTASRSNAQNLRKQRGDSKLNKCLILYAR